MMVLAVSLATLSYKAEAGFRDSEVTPLTKPLHQVNGLTYTWYDGPLCRIPAAVYHTYILWTYAGTC